MTCGCHAPLCKVRLISQASHAGELPHTDIRLNVAMPCLCCSDETDATDRAESTADCGGTVQTRCVRLRLLCKTATLTRTMANTSPVMHPMWLGPALRAFTLSCRLVLRCTNAGMPVVSQLPGYCRAL